MRLRPPVDLSHRDAVVKEVQAVQAAPTGGGEILATVLVAAPVASAVTAADLGDQRWRELVNRQEAFIRGGGSAAARVDRPQLARDPSTARRAHIGVRCLSRQPVRTLGIQMRVGLHTGECELAENDVSGAAVRVAARSSNSLGQAR